MNRQWLRLQMGLLALVAIPEVERRAAEWQARDGQKVPGEAKRRQALEHMLSLWPASTRSIPGLQRTLLDERRVRREAERALDGAWRQIGEAVNRLVRELDADPRTT